MTTSVAEQTILITGANTGIGRATARDLAKRGAQLILACRSREKTMPVITAIKQETGNPAIDYLELDLGDLASVRCAAEDLLKRDRPLHILVNNAGLAGQRGLTKDGFELAFGTNHLGHFLLTNLLLDRLRESAPARIVNVASVAHYDAKAIDFAALRRPTASLTGLHEYSVSKLCNVLFTQELARRLEATRVTTYAVHPGMVASDVWRSIPWPFREIFKRVRKMKTNEQGAAPLLRCAVAPELAAESGRYYHDRGEKPASAVATPELAHQLWRQSDEWTGVR